MSCATTRRTMVNSHGRTGESPPNPRSERSPRTKVSWVRSSARSRSPRWAHRRHTSSRVARTNASRACRSPPPRAAYASRVHSSTAGIVVRGTPREPPRRPGSSPRRTTMGGEEEDRHVTARTDLRADCSRCFAICCVAPAFSRSSDFAIDKPAGVPCPHLGGDPRCSIHDRLRPEGFAGCTAYDCFGAGQRLAQETFGGRDWRDHQDVAAPMMAALPVLRGLHELLWYLHDVIDLPTSVP